MTVETHDVLFSFERPDDAHNPLLSILQQLLNRPQARGSKAEVLLSAQKVLIIDSQPQRAQHIARVLASAGYQPFVALTSLDAYTIYLQGTFHPFAIILSEAGTVNQLFLQRLSQQFLQRYEWKLPFIRLHISPADQLISPTTEPLAGGRSGLSRSTLPLGRPQARQSGALEGGSPSSQPLSERAGQSGASVTPRHLDFDLTRPEERPARPAIPPQRPGKLSQPLRHAPNNSAPLQAPVTRPGASNPAMQEPFVSQTTVPSVFAKTQTEKISLTGLSIGRYHLKSIIGGSPFGDVYCTYDRLREQDIALKTIQTNMIPRYLLINRDEDDNLFQREWDLLQQVDHPNLSPVMNIGKSYISGFPFIYKTMPYYAEGSLHNWLAQFAGKIFEPIEVAQIIRQLADAIQTLHMRGILFQNFKITNILVKNETSRMGDLQVALSDISLTQNIMELSKTPDVYRYFAPEQWDGEAFTSSDQYGLAILTYELLAGRAPFQGNTDAIMRRMHTMMAPPPPSSFNRYLSPLIDKTILCALSKRPGDRFDSVQTFATLLERVTSQ